MLCTVTNVQYNSVFCTLDEYEGNGGKPHSGMIHISEVSAGRIKNIREFVAEGKKVYCKVLAVDKSRGHIDLSLRRVTEGQKRDRGLALKQEQRAEHILDHIAKEHKNDPSQFYAQVAPALLENHEFIFQAFDEIVEGTFSLSKTKLDPKMAKLIEETVKEKIKPKEVTIEGVFTISTFAENGVQQVREALVKARDCAKGADIRYLGAGQYKVTVTAEEFKDAEKQLKIVSESVEKSFKKSAGTEVNFERVETKK